MLIVGCFMLRVACFFFACRLLLIGCGSLCVLFVAVLYAARRLLFIVCLLFVVWCFCLCFFFLGCFVDCCLLFVFVCFFFNMVGGCWLSVVVCCFVCLFLCCCVCLIVVAWFVFLIDVVHCVC